MQRICRQPCTCKQQEEGVSRAMTDLSKEKTDVVGDGRADEGGKEQVRGRSVGDGTLLQGSQRDVNINPSPSLINCTVYCKSVTL